MILFIILLILTIIILLTAYVCYRLAFLAPKERIFDEDVRIHLPEGEEYLKVRKGIESCVDTMLSRSFEPVTIETFDGKKLYGRYYHVADGAPLQIQFHGYKSTAVLDFCGGSTYAGKIGHNALVVDHRSHGKSEGKNITFGVLERLDVLYWAQYARSRFGEDTPIILAGLSMGAATVLMACDMPLPKNVKGIIADCPYSSPKDIIKKVARTELQLPAELLYPFVKLGASLFAGFDLEACSAVSAAEDADLPILIIHGEADTFVPCDMSRKIQKANPEQVTLVTIEGAGHGLCYMTDSKKYEEAMMDFMQKIL